MILAETRKETEVSKFGGDAATVHEQLQRLQLEDPRWRFEVNYHPETGRLCRVIWSSPEMIELLTTRGDVLIGDIASGRNLYNLPLNTFCVVDDDGASRNVVYCIQDSEGAEMHRSVFRWIRDLVVSPPLVFVSDHDLAVDLALRDIFPSTVHFLCLHHLSTNLVKNLAGQLGKEFQTFVRAFWKLYWSLSKQLFESSWSKLLDDFPEASDYMEKVFWPIRERWAWYAVSSICTAGVRTNGRIERENRHNKTLGDAKTSLSTLISRLNTRSEEQAEKKRDRIDAVRTPFRFLFFFLFFFPDNI